MSKSIGSTNSVKPQTRIVRMDKLPSAEQETILAGLMAVDDAVFITENREGTINRLSGKLSDETWIMYMHAEGKILGYFAIFVNHIRYQGRLVSCWLSRAAVYPEFRGGNRTGNFSPLYFFRFRLKYPFRKIYGFLSTGHPSSFYLLTKRNPNLYPFPKTELEPQEREVYEFLYKHLGNKAVEGKPDFVVERETTIRTHPVEQEYWLNHPDPGVAFFHRYNGEYMTGPSILTFFEINLRLMLGVARRSFREKGGIARFLPFLKKEPGLKERIEFLRKIPLFNEMPEGMLKALAEIPIQNVNRGEYICRQGDEERAMYLILRGSAYVLLNPPEGEILVAQLQAGDYVGEFGLIYGTPRNASVKAFQPVEVLRIDQEKVQDLLLHAPDLAEKIYETLGRRLAVNWLHSHPEFSKLDFKERLELIKGLSTRIMPAREEYLAPESSKCILIKGTLQFGDKTYEAPVHFPLPAQAPIVATRDCLLLLIPLNQNVSVLQ